MKYPKFKGVEIPPYETFNFHDSEAFFSGAYGGIAKTLKAECHLAIIEIVNDKDGEDAQDQTTPFQM